jgi:hypothetical protein
MRRMQSGYMSCVGEGVSCQAMDKIAYLPGLLRSSRYSRGRPSGLQFSLSRKNEIFIRKGGLTCMLSSKPLRGSDRLLRSSNWLIG